MNVRNHLRLVVASLVLTAMSAGAQTVGPPVDGLSANRGPNAAGGAVATSIERQPLGRPAAKRDIGEYSDNEMQPKEAPSTASGLAGSAIAAMAVSGLIVAIGMLVKLVMRKRGGLMGAIGAGGRAPSGLVEVLARYPLGRQSTLIVLKIDRRVLLLNQVVGRGGSMTVLSEFTDPEEVASILLRTRDESEAKVAARFQDMLAGAAEPYGTTQTVEAMPRTAALSSLRAHLNAMTGVTAGAKGAA